MTDAKTKTTATIDLDALRAARGEADPKHAPTMRVGGKVWTLPPSLPADFMFRLGSMQAGDATQLEVMIRMAFGDDFEEIKAQLTVGDLKELVFMLPEVYAGGASPGGIARLSELIAEFWAEYETDFARFYSMNLADAIWGGDESRITLRRLCVLAMNLPMHGAVGNARGALAAAPWGHSEELLALIAELIHDNTRTFVVANSRKGSRPPKALKIPRPYAQPSPPKRPATNQELEAMFGPRRN